jgi:hypothetical protein
MKVLEIEYFSSTATVQQVIWYDCIVNAVKTEFSVNARSECVLEDSEAAFVIAKVYLDNDPDAMQSAFAHDLVYMRVILSVVYRFSTDLHHTTAVKPGSALRITRE